MSLKDTLRTGMSGTFNRGISDFKKCYQPRTDIVQDEKGNIDNQLDATITVY